MKFFFVSIFGILFLCNQHSQNENTNVNGRWKVCRYTSFLSTPTFFSGYAADMYIGKVFYLKNINYRAENGVSTRTCKDSKFTDTVVNVGDYFSTHYNIPDGRELGITDTAMKVIKFFCDNVKEADIIVKRDTLIIDIGIFLFLVEAKSNEKISETFLFKEYLF